MTELMMIIDTEYALFPDNESEDQQLKNLLTLLHKGISFDTLTVEEKKLLRSHGYDYYNYAFEKNWIS